MQEKSVSLRIPEVGFIAGTRVALGAGLGFLLAEKLNKDQRKGAGWVLLGLGALTTIPIIVNVVRKVKSPGRIAA